MEVSETAKLFNQNYFAHGCGHEYKRDEIWMARFGALAEKIVTGIAPKTVFDAGCAMGFLVEQLRTRGVETWGVDISEYAIQNAHESIQDYVWVGSVTDPLPRKYDLIVTIEVLEHISKEASEQALINLCQFTDDILFSSTPFDFKESTHFNVQPVEYWAELFAQQGFYRDIDFDATFITPWAARYRRRREPLPRMVRDYERWVWAARNENAELRERVIVDEDRINSLNQTVETLNETIKNQHQEIHLLHSEILKKEQYVISLEDQIEVQERSFEEQMRVWEEVQASAGWRFLSSVRTFRLRLAPGGSRRDRFIQLGINGVMILVREGPLSFMRRLISRRRTRVDNATAYNKWLLEHTPNEANLAQQRLESEEFSYRPLISILTPVYNPPPEVLRAMFESVLAQTYSNWELCVLDGNSDRRGVKEILAEYTQKDSRIHLKTLKQNLGISGNSNEAIQMAQGEYIQILDHDDVLAPDLLFEAVSRLKADPSIDLIYYDEDKLSENGEERCDPFFKPDWSPELLISANYLSHSMIRCSLAKDAGMFNPEMDGAQDWDLAFRVTERTNNIVHIPKILYHWRMISGSTSMVMNAKPGVFDAQLRSVENHLHRTGRERGRAILTAPGYLRVLWPIAGKKVSIIIPTKDKVEFLQKCVSSITQLTTYPDYEIILVDSGSAEKDTQDYYNVLRRDSRIKIVDFTGPFNYSAANNLGTRHAAGDIFLFLNNDTEVLDPDWLEEMARWAEIPDVGIVGAKLLYPDRTIQHAGVIVGLSGHADHVFQKGHERIVGLYGAVHWYRNYSAVTGACMMMRREVFDELQGFDEEYILAFSDIEICLRATEQGHRIVYTPYAQLKHYEGKSRGNHIPAKDAKRGADHFIELAAIGDPYFNPNLSYSQVMPTIAFKNEEDREVRLRRIGKLFDRSTLR